ncbi:MAG: helix-hairpin-helix domain-containing protein [Actinomycetes bacterium]
MELPNVAEVRFSTSRSDADADVIRARLRALLEDRTATGWVPEDDEPASDRPSPPAGTVGGAGSGDPPVQRRDDEEMQDGPGIGRHRAPGPIFRWDPGRSGARSLWLAGTVAALVLVGWTWFDRPEVEPAPPAPLGESLDVESPASTPIGEAAGSSAAVVVSVVGPVARPGLVTLSAGARVADAVEAAGGLLPGADPASVNLAAPVSDGEQIAVALPGASAAPAGTGTAGGDTAAGGPLDLNTATAADLDELPGIGPVLAQRIVDHRSRHGPFTGVDQLDDVPGIGPATAAELAELVAV